MQDSKLCRLLLYSKKERCILSFILYHIHNITIKYYFLKPLISLADHNTMKQHMHRIVTINLYKYSRIKAC
uniref:Uncharacterized protein n=1 Tax=Rhizophora mucronata TaxID=61149 RepID=A0A2P2R310_RHIMU